MERKIKKYVRCANEIRRDAEEEIHRNLLAYAHEIGRNTKEEIHIARRSRAYFVPTIRRGIFHLRSKYISSRRYVGIHFARRADVPRPYVCICVLQLSANLCLNGGEKWAK